MPSLRHQAAPAEIKPTKPHRCRGSNRCMRRMVELEAAKSAGQRRQGHDVTTHVESASSTSFVGSGKSGPESQLRGSSTVVAFKPKDATSPFEAAPSRSAPKSGACGPSGRGMMGNRGVDQHRQRTFGVSPAVVMARRYDVNALPDATLMACLAAYGRRPNILVECSSVSYRRGRRSPDVALRATGPHLRLTRAARPPRHQRRHAAAPGCGGPQPVATGPLLRLAEHRMCEPAGDFADDIAAAGAGRGWGVPRRALLPPERDSA